MPDQPATQLPVVQRLRVRYAKRGRLRFTSHRDFARALERAVRRAGLPVAFSSGFSPHPRISYANASPTGAASEAEYFELALSAVVDADAVRVALDAALPDGLDVEEVVAAGPGSLMDRLTASRWRIRLPGLTVDEVAAAAAAFLAHGPVEVERMTKRGLRTFDCREPVVTLTACACADPPEPCAILEMVVRHGTPAVRPDDVLVGLRVVAGLVPPMPPLETRIAQGPLDAVTGAVTDPLDPDRESSDGGLGNS